MFYLLSFAGIVALLVFTCWMSARQDIWKWSGTFVVVALSAVATIYHYNLPGNPHDAFPVACWIVSFLWFCCNAAFVKDFEMERRDDDAYKARASLRSTIASRNGF